MVPLRVVPLSIQTIATQTRGRTFLSYGDMGATLNSQARTPLHSPLGEVKKIARFWSAHARHLPPARRFIFIFRLLKKTSLVCFHNDQYTRETIYLRSDI